MLTNLDLSLSPNLDSICICNLLALPFTVRLLRTTCTHTHTASWLSTSTPATRTTPGIAVKPQTRQTPGLPLGWAGIGVCRPKVCAELPTIESRSQGNSITTPRPGPAGGRHLEAIAVCRGFRGDGSDRSSVKTSVPCIHTGAIAAELVRPTVRSPPRHTAYTAYTAHHRHHHLLLPSLLQSPGTHA